MTQARDTSIEAYNRIVDTGAIRGMQLAVYTALVHRGPMTGSEVDEYLRRDSDKMDPSYSRRLSELRDMGLIREARRRDCRVTGNVAIEWEPTYDPPGSLKKRTKRPSLATIATAVIQIRNRMLSDMPTETKQLLARIEQSVLKTALECLCRSDQDRTEP